jgi:tetratricopeptide (TPR) repeat protein
MNPASRLLLAEALDRLGRGDEATPLLAGLADDPRHPKRGDALLLLGRIASRRNSLPEAERLLRSAISVATARREPGLEGTARRYVAVVLRKAGDLDGAEAELALAIPLLVSAGDPRDRVRARLDVAVLRLQRGDDAGAAGELEGLLSDPAAGPREEAAIRSNLAITWVRMGRPEEAAVLFEESARAAERGGDFRAAGYALANAADAHLAAGRVPEAESSLTRARQVSGGFADPLLESTVLTNEGKVLVAQGKPGAAEERLRAGVERIRGLGNVASLIERVDELARFYEGTGRAEDAVRWRRDLEDLRGSLPRAVRPPARGT